MATIRYIEDKEIRWIRVRTWVEAVLQASGLTLVELEQKFSDVKSISPTSRSCIWDKYRNGTVVPRIGTKPNGELHLASKVEIEYPGTLQWLTSPLWRLSDKAPMSMEEIKFVYQNLPYLYRSIFIEADYKITGLFWRRCTELEECCETLKKLDGLDAFISHLAMIKEAEISQDQDIHYYLFDSIFEYKKKLKNYQMLKLTIKPLIEYLKDRWKSAGYFD